MTMPAATIMSAVIFTLGLLVSAYLMSAKSQVARYQLVNVGNGDTHRMDRETGAVSLCYSEGCVPLETISDDVVVWDEPQ